MAQDRAATSPPRKNETKRSGSDSGTEIDIVPDDEADETHATVPTVQTVEEHSRAWRRSRRARSTSSSP